MGKIKENIYPTVDIIILTYNSEQYICSVLDHINDLIYPKTKLGVYIVDNNSSDNTILLCKSYLVNIIEAKQNKGFSAGNNIGLKYGTGDIKILLNPDVLVTPMWLQNIVLAFERDPKIGIIGSKLYFPNTNIIQHAGGYCEQESRALMNHYFYLQEDCPEANIIKEVDYVCGASFAIKQDVINTIGYLDENFFLYYEDTDYCYRARFAGFKIIYCPKSIAYHYETPNKKSFSRDYYYNLHLGRLRFLLKHMPIDIIYHNTFKDELFWLTNITTLDPDKYQDVLLVMEDVYTNILFSVVSIIIMRDNYLPKTMYVSDFSDIITRLLDNFKKL